MALWPFGRKKRKTDKLNEKSMANNSKGKDQDVTKKDSSQIAPDTKSNNAASATLHKAKSKDIPNRRRTSSGVSSKAKTATLKDIEYAEPLPPVPPNPSRA